MEIEWLYVKVYLGILGNEEVDKFVNIGVGVDLKDYSEV